MGYREQLRANLKQQEKATPVAHIHRDSLLGDMACEDLWSGAIIVVISAPQWSPGAQAVCLDLPTSQSVYSQPRQQGKGMGLATRLNASVQLQQQHSCLFIWSMDTGGFSFLCCPTLFNCLFYLQYRQKRSKRPRRCRGVFLISYSKRPPQLSSVNQCQHQAGKNIN